jgi:hypothetical protein
MAAIRKRDGYDWKFEAEEQQRRVAKLEAACDAALRALIKKEPPDSQVVQQLRKVLGH